MFGRGRRTHAQPVAVTTTRSRPMHSTGGGFMSRLRPRRNTYATSAPVTTTTARPRRTHHKKHGLGVSTAPRRHRHHGSTVTTTTHSTTVPARKTSLGDKVSGAMLKLRGSLTGRPGLKGAGTRRMHGTDGRGTHRRYY